VFVRTPGGLVQLPDREANPIRSDARLVGQLEVDIDGLCPLPAGKGRDDFLRNFGGADHLFLLLALIADTYSTGDTDLSAPCGCRAVRLTVRVERNNLSLREPCSRFVF
jgi:hypothetical protein